MLRQPGYVGAQALGGKPGNGTEDSASASARTTTRGSPSAGGAILLFAVDRPERDPLKGRRRKGAAMAGTSGMLEPVVGVTGFGNKLGQALQPTAAREVQGVHDGLDAQRPAVFGT